MDVSGQLYADAAIYEGRAGNIDDMIQKVVLSEIDIHNYM
jgi:hypothetical protein